MNKNDMIFRLKSQPIISSHSHHLQDEEHHNLSLEKILSNSYVNWCGKPIPSGQSKDEISVFLNAVRNRSYFVWLEKSLMELYKIDTYLNTDTWTSEESYGARLGFLEILSQVLYERIEKGIMGECDAIQYAKAIMHNNAARILKL